MQRLRRLRAADREVIEKFLNLEDWRKRITGVILMTASPSDSMKREAGHLPVVQSGSIMNVAVLRKMLKIVRESATKFKNEFRVVEIDTSSNAFRSNAEKVTERAAKVILDLIDEQLEEEILSAPLKQVSAIFDSQISIGRDKGNSLLELFSKHGNYRPRRVVEEDSRAVQALPVVVVRNRSGEILRLKRREQNPDNPLHEQFVIWAGGHVRREDGYNGSSVVRGAIRELQEELRLSINPSELVFLGAVYSTGRERSRKHCAIVYEWQADTDDVEMVLSSAEFFERRGTSVSGKFISAAELARELDNGSYGDEWSQEICGALLSDMRDKVGRKRLF